MRRVDGWPHRELLGSRLLVLVVVMAGLLVVFGVGGDDGIVIEGDPVVAPDEPEDVVKKPPRDGVPAVAPECRELRRRPYSPPPEEQPPPEAPSWPDDPSRPPHTHGRLHPDLPLITSARPLPDMAVVVFEQLDHWGERRASKHFGGTWYDGRFEAYVIAFTDDVDAYAEVVRDELGAYWWWVVEVDHTYSSLLKLYHEIEPSGEPAPGAIIYSYPSRSVNRVELHLFEPDEQRLAELSARYGAHAICFEVYPIPGDENGKRADWRLASDADLSPDRTSLDILVTEIDCVDESAEGRIVEPHILYDAEQVTIMIRVVPLPEIERATEPPRPHPRRPCPGNPDTPYTVELDEPLGRRGLSGSITRERSLGAGSRSGSSP